MSCKRFVLSFLIVQLPLLFALSRTDETPQSLVPINDIFSVDQFNKIRDFVFKDGDRQAYCPRSGNVPHLKIADSDIDVYLIDFSQKNSPQSTDYNVIYFVSEFNGTPFNYYLYIAKPNVIYLYDYKNLLKNKVIEKEVLFELKEKIRLVLEDIDKTSV